MACQVGKLWFPKFDHDAARELWNPMAFDLGFYFIFQGIYLG